ncbi:hypothetical protein U9M48_004422 [Paspalum notatum var. saurae]|uniref:Reverse transcriptase domain-containing protein n=1 Tax=Paspalum notatum var. saurae TaxID=547442 RepID=A0AAQ3SHP2_PASNO
MLFILAIDQIQRILEKATEQGLLSPIGSDPIRLRTSLYADDAALFLRPTQQDVENLQLLVERFGEATGLKTNIQKSEIYKTNCEALNISNILDHFWGNIAEFPCKYLGLPLWIGRTSRADEQIFD